VQQLTAELKYMRQQLTMSHQLLRQQMVGIAIIPVNYSTKVWTGAPTPA
jgi:hypothetical protein